MWNYRSYSMLGGTAHFPNNFLFTFPNFFQPFQCCKCKKQFSTKYKLKEHNNKKNPCVRECSICRERLYLKLKRIPKRLNWIDYLITSKNVIRIAKIYDRIKQQIADKWNWNFDQQCWHVLFSIRSFSQYSWSPQQFRKPNINDFKLFRHNIKAAGVEFFTRKVPYTLIDWRWCTR